MNEIHGKTSCQSVKNLFFAILFIFFLLPINSHAQSSTNKHVLFLSSYTLAWPTVPLQISGIQSVLGQSAAIDYEFMDTKKIAYRENRKHHYESIKKLLLNAPKYDAIIVGDDAALQLVLDNYNELFSNIPIVFQGINDVDRAMEAVKRKNITGIIEKDTYKENIEYARKLYPNGKEIIAIIDDSLTGEGQKKLFLKYAAQYPELTFSVIDLSSLSYKDFIGKLEKLTDHSIPFLFAAGRDIKDKAYTDKEIVATIQNYSPVPVMTMVHTGATIEYGLLGGAVVDHFESGKISGTMVKQIMSGIPVKNISLVTNSPDVRLFNYQVLKKNHIEISKLPKNIVLVNQDLSFFEKYNQAILIILSLMVAASFIVLVIMLRLRSRLVSKIADRNKQLIEISNQATQANKAKTMFLSRMSHEIRTPMNAIIGLTNILQKDKTISVSVGEKLDKITMASSQLLDLINDVLDTSAIEQQKLRINLQPFDLNDFIASVVDFHISLFRQKNIHFSLSVHLDDGMVTGDPMRIRQILNNLISNAIKFTNQGGNIKLDVIQRKITSDVVYVDFVVTDNGCGIDDEMKERIFKPFEQESAETATVYGGSGLGLSICKSLTEMMRSSITVKSEKNRGSIFTISLPFNRVSAREKPGVDQSDTQHEKQYDFSAYRLLLVEDNELNREVAAELLKMTGIKIDTASNGQEAVNQFLQSLPGTYSIILMDIQMPVMNGHQATEKIRKSSHPDAKTIPIIAMSANISPEDIAAALHSGMNDHIGKPIDCHVLYSEIDKFLNKRKPS